MSLLCDIKSFIPSAVLYVVVSSMMSLCCAGLVDYQQHVPLHRPRSVHHSDSRRHLLQPVSQCTEWNAIVVVAMLCEINAVRDDHKVAVRSLYACVCTGMFQQFD